MMVVAGGIYHDAPVPVDGGALTTARRQFEEAVRVRRGARAPARVALRPLGALGRGHAEGVGGPGLKGPTTHTKGNVPEDFREAFAAYVAQDDQPRRALELLDAHVAFPRCERMSSSAA